MKYTCRNSISLWNSWGVGINPSRRRQAVRSPLIICLQFIILSTLRPSPQQSIGNGSPSTTGTKSWMYLIISMTPALELGLAEITPRLAFVTEREQR